MLSQKVTATSEKGGVHCIQNPGKWQGGLQWGDELGQTRVPLGCPLWQPWHQGTTLELPLLHLYCEGSRLLHGVPWVGCSSEPSALWLWSPVPWHGGGTHPARDQHCALRPCLISLIIFPTLFLFCIVLVFFYFFFFCGGGGGCCLILFFPLIFVIISHL